LFLNLVWDVLFNVYILNASGACIGTKKSGSVQLGVHVHRLYLLICLAATPHVAQMEKGDQGKICIRFEKTGPIKV